MKRTMVLVDRCILRPSSWLEWTRVCLQLSIDVLKTAARMMLSACRAAIADVGGKAPGESATASDPNETFGRLAWRAELEYPEVARSAE